VPHFGATLDAETLRLALFGQLADAKIPSRVAVVDALPKGSTGKLRRQALADRLERSFAVDYVAPTGHLETQVASMYAEVLGVARVGARDNFFVLGGDSLRGAQLLARVETRFGVTLTLATLFKRPTPAQIADAIDTASAMPEVHRLPPVEPQPR